MQDLTDVVWRTSVVSSIWLFLWFVFQILKVHLKNVQIQRHRTVTEFIIMLIITHQDSLNIFIAVLKGSLNVNLFNIIRKTIHMGGKIINADPYLCSQTNPLLACHPHFSLSKEKKKYRMTGIKNNTSLISHRIRMLNSWMLKRQHLKKKNNLYMHQ